MKDEVDTEYSDYPEGYLDVGFSTISGLQWKIIELEHKKKRIMSAPPTDSAREMVEDIENEIMELQLDELDL